MGSSNHDRVELLLAKMTLTEKVGQLNQKMLGWNAYRREGDALSLTDAFREEVGRYGGMGALYGVFRADPWSAVTFSTGLGAKESAKVANQIQKYVKENTRLGIPVLLSEECPHGHMAIDGTLLPTNIGVGATWNPELYRKVTELVAKEVRSRGAHLGLISTLDMARDPRWGRTEECYSEDPYLAARLAHAAIEGLQGTGRAHLRSQDGIAAVAKHFVAQGGGEGGRNAAPVAIGERELREIHLPAAHAAVQAGAMAVMAAYNEIDGVPCHGNPRLLRKLLRDEWGFDGFVMSDGCALDRLVSLTGSSERAGRMALEGGVDLSLWDSVYPDLEKAVQTKVVKEELINEAVRRILHVKFELGLFDNPYVEEERWQTSVGFEEIRNSSLQLARESLVLLENKAGFLPLSTVGHIAVIGPNADSLSAQLGDYTPPQRPGRGKTVRIGMAEVAGPNVTVTYARGCGIMDPSKAGFAEAIEVAKRADVVVLVLGGSSERDFGVQFDSNGAAILDERLREMDCGEGVDVADVKLPGVQLELAREISNLGKPIVGVLIQGRPYALGDLPELCKGLLCAWYPGPYGGTAIAEVIFGMTNPGGRLPISIPRSSGQLPVFYNRKDGSGDLPYLDLPKGARYPFGFGLSYTKFEYSELRVDVGSSHRVRVELTVKNVGNREGAEVVQLYLRREQCSVTPRIKELKGVQKIWLEPGRTQVVKFELGKSELSIWNPDMYFVIEPGKFFVHIGGDSQSPALIGDFTLTQETNS
jgi:beta-glucosidase